MNIKKIALTILICIFLTGCTKTNEEAIVQTSIELTEVIEGGSIVYQNENIKIKISNKIENPEEIYEKILNELQTIDKFSKIGNIEIQVSKQYNVPSLDKIIKCDEKYIETEDLKKQLIKRSYDIYDNWIIEGTYGNIYNIEKTDFTTYYTNNEFALFGARFFEPFASKEEIESIKSASMDLVEYMLENNKKEELLKNEIYMKDIEKWAGDKNIDLTYQKEIESLMNRVEVYETIDRLVINTMEEVNGFIVSIPSRDIKKKAEGVSGYDSAKKVEELLLGFDDNILSIRRGVELEAPKFYAEYKELLSNNPKINYNINAITPNTKAGGYYVPLTNEIELVNPYGQAHEYCHFLFDYPLFKEGININRLSWLYEGVANYLDVVYSKTYEKWIEKRFRIISDPIQYYKMDDVGDDIIREVEELCNEEFKIYYEYNIKEDNIEEVLKDRNRRLISSYVEYSFIIKTAETIDNYTIPRGSATNDLITEGDNMDYIVQFSFGPYLIEEYGLEKILYLYVSDLDNLTYKEYFGKTFEELKVDWMNYLKENIKGIESIL